jgi:hypothetical protein
MIKKGTDFPNRKREPAPDRSRTNVDRQWEMRQERLRELKKNLIVRETPNHSAISNFHYLLIIFFPALQHRKTSLTDCDASGVGQPRRGSCWRKL